MGWERQRRRERETTYGEMTKRDKHKCNRDIGILKSAERERIERYEECQRSVVFSCMVQHLFGSLIILNLTLRDDGHILFGSDGSILLEDF